MSWNNNWNGQESYNRPNKRRYDQIHGTISSLREELAMNDYLLTNELHSGVFCDYDRDLLALELYKERLLALTTSARSQVMVVQLGATLARCAQSNQPAYYAWSPKRMKYNQSSGPSSYSPNQYNEQNAWTEYSSSSNSYYSNHQAPNFRKSRKRKRNVARGNAIPVQVSTRLVNPGTTTPKTATVPNLSAPTQVKTTTAHVTTTSAQVTSTATVKKTATTVKGTATATKTTTTCTKTTTQQIKTASTNKTTMPEVTAISYKTYIEQMKAAATAVKTTTALTTTTAHAKTPTVAVSTSTPIANKQSAAVKTPISAVKTNTASVKTSTASVKTSTAIAKTTVPPVSKTTALVSKMTTTVNKTTIPVSKITATVTKTTAPINQTIAPISKTAVPVSKNTASVSNTASPVTKTPAPINTPTAPPNTNTVSVNIPTASVNSTIAPNNTTAAPVNTVTAPINEITASVNTTAAPVSATIAQIEPTLPVKKESDDTDAKCQNVPSIFSMDLSHIKLQFAGTDRITIRSDNLPSETIIDLTSNTIKTEPNMEDNSMFDDLEDHI